MQQPSGREMQGMTAQMALHELQNGQQSGISGGGLQNDDFFDQMLSGLPGGWSDLGEAASAGAQKLFGLGLGGKSPEEPSAQAADGIHYAPYDESSLLASRLRQHQISGGGGSSPTGKQMMLQLNHHGHQQQMLLSGMGRSPGAGGEAGMLPLPLTLGSGGGGSADSDGPFKSPSSTGGEALYNGFGGSLQRAAQAPNQQHFHHPQGSAMTSQNYGGASQPPAGVGHGQSSTATASASVSAGGGTAPPRQRVRARRGQATDPHSIAERLRRERIAERMKNLQELVPNANKTDKASMLDEIIDYVKFLQLQVKVLSMSRLGGAAAVAPLVADMSSESGIGGRSRASGGGGGSGGGSDSMTVTEHQVAKLMEEDMGSAMQYLQGKGLCLMPISLASAISSATCHPRPPQAPSGTTSSVLNHALAAAAAAAHAAAGQQPSSNSGGDGPTSPSMSVLTVQSAMANGSSAAAPDADGQRTSGGKDGTSKQ